MSVSHSVHRVSLSETPAPFRQSPPPDRDPPDRDTLLDRDPAWTETPPGQSFPLDRDPRMVMSGRYASNWNVLLLLATTKLGQGNVFTGICDSVHGRGCLPQCMLGYHPPLGSRPPRADTPKTRQPPRTRHPRDQPPPAQKNFFLFLAFCFCSGIRSTSGRYASYWNAFLFHIIFKTKNRVLCVYVNRS